MDSKKYIILDMGKVLVGPTTGGWLRTPTFMKNVDESKIDIKELNDAFKFFGYILEKKAVSIEEEYELIYEFYSSVFSKIDYKISEDKLENIVNDFVYNETDSKYYMYNDVKEQLERLSKKYTILMLSDNWPCAINYLKEHDIYKYFTKVYISSVYGEKKSDKVFFDYPIREFNIKKGEALFVDDNESLLDIAVEKSLDVMLMDRANEVTSSKYTIINSLSEIK